MLSLYKNSMSNNFCENSVMMKISVMQQLYTLQEKDSSLKKNSSCRLKFPEKIRDSAWKIYYKQQGKFKNRYSHSHYEVSIPNTP